MNNLPIKTGKNLSLNIMILESGINYAQLRRLLLKKALEKNGRQTGSHLTCMASFLERD